MVTIRRSLRDIVGSRRDRLEVVGLRSDVNVRKGDVLCDAVKGGDSGLDLLERSFTIIALIASPRQKLHVCTLPFWNFDKTSHSHLFHPCYTSILSEVYVTSRRSLEGDGDGAFHHARVDIYEDSWNDTPRLDARHRPLDRSRHGEESESESWKTTRSMMTNRSMWATQALLLYM